ncbi:BamA/TamA family outer membrane protein [Lutibacter holmesii]|uniref:BamA/TamA family outer membrane protein n=1 Tax=Lutibacter holmesii TaxID=1137985 RepID=A0ABW3WR77_9FLAO
MVKYSTSFGASFGFMAAGYYKLNPKDTISPISSTSLIASYTTNKSWLTVVPSKFYFKEDKFRSKIVFGMGTINFQTYLDWENVTSQFPPGIFPDFEDDGTFVDYTTNLQAFYGDFLVNVYDRLYVGGNIIYSRSTTSFDIPLKPDDTQSLFGFGVYSEFDTRNNQMMPINGFNSKFLTTSYLEALGSTSNYHNISFEYNKYFQQGERNTLLLRAYAQISLGDVPFSGKNIVGRDDLRGYSNGKYRANQVYDVQSEYRHWFSKRWGYVAFGGFATAIDTAKDIRIDNVLPAVGAGIRFLAIPSSNISIGMDLAVGKDDWGIYFRISEAFTR